jgi:beta-1,4-N-acetylglucosaminyltransferase
VILVIVGSSRLPFDRLMNALHGLPRNEELIVQGGASTAPPPHARRFDYLEFNALVELIRQARVVVTHAGVGSIMTVLAEGKRPIVVPRSRQAGELIDDHQIVLARRLAAAELVVAVEDLDDLPKAVEEGGGDSNVSIAPDRRLIEDLRSYLESQIRRPRSHADR